MIALDTNVLVRHLAQDDAVQSAAASAFIEGQLTADVRGFVSVIVLCELCWVLTGAYGLDRPGLTRVLDGLLSVDALAFEHRPAMARAIELHRVGGPDFADCYLLEVAREFGCAELVTFDQRFAKLEGVRLLA